MTKQESKNDNCIVGYVLADESYKHFILSVAQKARKANLEFIILCVENLEDKAKIEQIKVIERFVKSSGGQFVIKNHIKQVEAIVEYIEQDISCSCETFYIQYGSASRMLSIVGLTFAEQIRKILGKKIHIVELNNKKKYYSPLFFLIKNDDVSVKNIFLSIFVTVSIFILFQCFHSFDLCRNCGMSLSDITPVLMIASFALTIYYGLISGALSVLTSILIIGYYFIEPTGGIGSLATQQRIHLSVFLGCDILGNILCALIKAENIIIKNNKKILRTLFKVYRSATRELDSEKVIDEFYKEVTELLNTRVVFYSVNKETHEIQTVSSNEEYLEDTDKDVILKCFEEVKTVKKTVTNNGINYIRNYMQLLVSGKKYGVIVIDVPHIFNMNFSYTVLIYSVRDLLADLLERSILIESIRDHKIHLEQEKLRSTLLSSVSHDFKTPLSSIVCSLQQYKRMKNKGTLTNEIAENLIDIANDESERLSRFIGNILNATQLENNLIKFTYSWADPLDVISNTARGIIRKCAKIEFNEELVTRKYEIYVDPVMIETAILNILENAIKYSLYKPEIYISGELSEEKYKLRFKDNGPGILETGLHKIFDKYERIRQTDSKIAGTGLGLSIVKQIMHKHQGDVTAENSKDGGMVFCLEFPKWRISSPGNND